MSESPKVKWDFGKYKVNYETPHDAKEQTINEIKSFFNSLPANSQLQSNSKHFCQDLLVSSTPTKENLTIDIRENLIKMINETKMQRKALSLWNSSSRNEEGNQLVQNNASLLTPGTESILNDPEICAFLLKSISETRKKNIDFTGLHDSPTFASKKDQEKKFSPYDEYDDPQMDYALLSLVPENNDFDDPEFDCVLSQLDLSTFEIHKNTHRKN